MTQQQAQELITRLRLNRRAQISTLREENAELIKIIADFDTRLAEVEAQRDELQFKLDLCNAIARRISIKCISNTRRSLTL
jgi:ribosomal protein S13